MDRSPNFHSLVQEEVTLKPTCQVRSHQPIESDFTESFNSCWTWYAMHVNCLAFNIGTASWFDFPVGEKICIKKTSTLFCTGGNFAGSSFFSITFVGLVIYLPMWLSIKKSQVRLPFRSKVLLFFLQLVLNNSSEYDSLEVFHTSASESTLSH